MSKKHFNWLMVILWMALIFTFSHQPGNISDKNSKLVIYLFDMLGLDLNGLLGEVSNFIVRKLAHFTEYFILYMFLIRAMNYKNFKIENIFIAVIYVFLYAASDEIHQAFVPNRGPAIRDVIIDTSGAIFAMIIYYLKTKHKFNGFINA
ncbi:VanZ family protein [Clostridium sediminicola]|uniref:VanZ family protein n=1 Tax=Clostridium sediminicola TaxID=3114879 RepID=UPI0031F23F65